jgi:hypothetical protein
MGTIVVVTAQVHLHRSSTKRMSRLPADMGLQSCGINMAQIIRARILSVLGREWHTFYSFPPPEFVYKHIIYLE